MVFLHEISSTKYGYTHRNLSPKHVSFMSVLHMSASFSRYKPLKFKKNIRWSFFAKFTVYLYTSGVPDFVGFVDK